jgi:hypothetical protein
MKDNLERKLETLTTKKTIRVRMIWKSKHRHSISMEKLKTLRKI